MISQGIFIFIICAVACFVWAMKSAARASEQPEKEPLLEHKCPDPMFDLLEKQVEDLAWRNNIKMTHDQQNMLVAGLYIFVSEREFKAHQDGIESVNGKCQFDTDGDGNCHHCLDNPGGCFTKEAQR